jgi:hypothetical protein
MKVVREITHRPSGQRWKSFVIKPDGNTEDDDAAIQRLRDPKGELFAITARHRREKLGNKIIVLCPWAKKLSSEFAPHWPFELPALPRRPSRRRGYFAGALEIRRGAFCRR